MKRFTKLCEEILDKTSYSDFKTAKLSDNNDEKKAFIHKNIKDVILQMIEKSKKSIMKKIVAKNLQDEAANWMVTLVMNSSSTLKKIEYEITKLDDQWLNELGINKEDATQILGCIVAALIVCSIKGIAFKMQFSIESGFAYLVNLGQDFTKYFSFLS